MITTRYVISQALLSGLAGLMPGEKSPLSPLQITDPTPFTPEQNLQLENLEILDNANTPSEPAQQLLNTLAEIASLARVHLTTPAGAVDQTIHFSADGTQSVQLAHTADELVLSAPADPESVLAEIRNFIGSLQRQTTSWSVQLPPPEMQALAALMDLRRRAVLRALADQRPVVPPPSDPAAIASAITAMNSNPQWFTAAVQSAATLPAEATPAQVQIALSALVGKNLAGQHGNSFLPGPEAIQVADRFLILNTFLSLNAARSNRQGATTSTSQAWLGSGAGELVHLAPAQDQLVFELVSSATALEQIGLFLTQFDILTAPALDILPLAVHIQTGASIGKVIDLGDETVLGRSEQADIHLLDSRASRRHSIVRRLADGYFLNDAGSTNGTLLNNHPVTEPTLLAEGDLILIGETLLKVVPAGALPTPAPENAPTMVVGDAMRLIGETPPLPAAPGPIHSALNTPDAQQPFPPLQVNPAAVPEPVAPPPPIPAAPSQPQASANPEVPPRWFVPPPPPVKPAPIIPPPPVLTPAPFEAPPSGPAAHPTTAKPAQCARCSQPLASGDLVCMHCGQPVGQPVMGTAPVMPQTLAVCPKCFTPISSNGNFCGTCGNRLT